MAALVSNWLRHFRLLLWNRWTEFNETWQEARYQRPIPSLCFSGQSEKQDGRPGLWLAGTFSTYPLKSRNGIQRNLSGCKFWTSSTKFVFFGPIGKTRCPPWPLIGWDIYDFSSETAERNWTKLDRKQYLNVLYQVCVFRSDWKKQDECPGLWLADTFSTSSLKSLNGIQWNLTGSKISTSSSKFVFFRPMSKQKMLPWLICKNVAHCTQVHDMLPFGPLVFNFKSLSLHHYSDNVMLYFICIGFAELWAMGSNRKNQNENVCPRRESNQRSSCFQACCSHHSAIGAVNDMLWTTLLFFFTLLSINTYDSSCMKLILVRCVLELTVRHNLHFLY